MRALRVASFAPSLLVAAGLVACAPDLGPTGSLVTATEILAIQATPAEAPPGASVSYRALVASPTGTVTGAAIDWAYCTAPKPVSEDNVVSGACLGASSIVSLGEGPSSAANVPIPVDACALFGPDVPPQPAGQPPLRPRDPDATGGYYQPLRARLDEDTAFGLERITCNLAGATADVAADLRARYTPNKNPRLVGVTAFAGDTPVDLSQLSVGAAAGASLRFVATWTAGDAETYPVLDPLSDGDALVDRTETLRASWFATAGQFDTDGTGATSSTSASTENGWTPAGTVAGAVHFWVVLVDDRGGVDFLQFDAE